MKSSKTIMDFFKVQNANLTCPACGILLPKSKLNLHLDSECPSSMPSNKGVGSNHAGISLSSSKKITPFEVTLKSKTIAETYGVSTSKCNSSKLGRLSLKRQKANASNKSDTFINKVKCFKETEVITLDEDSSSSTDNKKCSIIDNTMKSNDYSIVQNNENSNFEVENKNMNVIRKEEGKSSTSVELESKLNLPIIAENQELPLAEINTLQSAVTSGEKHDIKLINASVATHSTSHDLLVCNKHEVISDSNYTPSSKLGTVSVNNSTLPCDSTVNVLPKSSNELNSTNNSIASTDIMAVLNDAQESLDADDNVFTENSDKNEKTESYSPYYIANFKHILNTVLQDEHYKILFNDEDAAFVKAFESSSDAAQKLYVRLFQRKFKWLRLCKINYPNITKDTDIFLKELVGVGLVEAGLSTIDLETALDLLSLPEARIIAKQFKFNLSGKSKTDITRLFLKHCKQHKSVFFCNGKNSISSMMLKKVNEVLGSCYRISLLPKRLFTRILMLFSLPTISEDDDDAAGGQQQQLLTLLQVNKGEITFPNYKINRQMMIFTERDELIRYEEAKQLENDIMNAVESKNFELAKELYIEAKEEYENQILCLFVERAASLPTFLKKYSSFHIYIRCMTQGVEILQRLRQYKEAVELLKYLLDQKVFCQDYHGRWWDRMALNLEQHLKERQQALEAIKEGIKDKNVRVGYRYSLLTRALRILKNVDEKDEVKKEILEAANVIEAPKVVIKGRLFPRNILGRRHIFISSSSTVTDENDITVLGVEQLAIEHYKSESFTEGIHGESSTFHSLYGLLFWDIIYDGDIPDAFISPYQTHPLDLNHESFFIRREKQILNHLEALRSSTVEELHDIVKSSWEAHFGQSSLVMWDRFRDVEHILGLVSCMGNHLLCGISERLARDFRFTRSGVPDLVVWNPETLQVKIVEVKGPGDRLSSKQILWLDYLLKLGAQAEVCHVEAVGSKKLRKE